jgi:uncharacterized membrane protein
VVAALLLPDGVRFVLLPAVLFLPGHALVMALFGTNEPSGDVVIRVALRVVLSLAVLPIVGVVVALASVAFNRTTVVLVTGAVCVTAAIVGRLRTPIAATVPQRPGSADATGEPPRAARVAWWYALAIALAIGAVLVTQAVMADPIEEPYSRLAIVGSVADFTGRSGEVEVTVDVLNGTGRARDYQVGAVSDGGPVWTPTVVHLEAGETGRLALRGAVAAGPCDADLRVVLQTAGRPTQVLTIPRSAPC